MNSGPPCNIANINNRPQFPGNGVKCDWNGTTGTDDTSRMNAVLATFTAGTVAQIAPGKQCLIDSANLTIPDNVILQGSAGAGQQNGSTLAILTNSSGIVLNPSFTVTMGAGSQLRDLIIRRKGLIIAPSAAQTISQVATWATENSVGVTMPASKPGIIIDGVMVIGFNQCYRTNTGRFTLKNSAGDCINGFEVYGSGDVGAISNVRFEPYYRSADSFASGNGSRPGVAFSLHDGDGGITITDSFSFMFATGLLTNNGTSVFVKDTTFEWHDNFGNGIAQNSCLRLLTSSADVWLTNVSCNGFDGGMANESHGAPVWITNPAHQPGIGTAMPSYYFGAQLTANPPQLVLAGTPVAGQTVSAVFTDGTGIVGSPLTVTYKIRPGDTLSTAGQNFAMAINGAWQLSINRIQAFSTAGTLTVSWPTGYTTLSSLTCSGSGSTTCTASGTGTAGSGSVTQLINPYMSVDGYVCAGCDSSNAINQATITNPYPDTSPPVGGQFQIGSASVTKVQIESWTPSAITNAGNISGCGTGSSVTSGSTDISGIVNEGVGATGCTVTFVKPYPANPFCRIELLGGSGTLATVTVTTTSIVITNGSQSIFSYDCSQNGPNMSGTYNIPNPPPPSPSIQVGALTGTCCSGATTETIIGTIKIPGNSMGSKGSTALDCLYSYPNSANTKTFRWRLTTNASGSTSGNLITSDASATTTSEAQTRFVMRNTSTASQTTFGTTPLTPYGSNVGSPTALALDTTGDLYISVNAITASGAETITLEQCQAIIANVP